MFDYGLLSKKQSHLVTQMELATLFYAFCADRFLQRSSKDEGTAEGDGTIAFVMPRSVLTGAKQHAEFRKKYVAAADLIVDCEQVAPLFNVPACVVIARKSHGEEVAGGPVTMLCLDAQLPNRNASYDQACVFCCTNAQRNSLPGRAEHSATIGARLSRGLLWPLGAHGLSVRRRSPA